MITNNTIVTSVKVPRTMHDKLIQAVVMQNYGLRGKTKWVIEAITDFLSKPEQFFSEQADYAREMRDLDVVLSLRLPDTIMRSLEDAVIIVRKYYPAMEGVKSNIVRAAILQKLVRSD